MMGYETTIIVGPLINFNNEESWLKVYATVELGKLGESCLYGLPFTNPKHPVYWFAPTGDGDTQRYKDRYDQSLNPLPILHVIQKLQTDIRENNYFSRTTWALALLQSMHDNSTEDLYCLLYGH